MIKVSVYSASRLFFMMSAQNQYPPILQNIDIDPTNHSFLPYISFVYTPQINGLYKRKSPFRSKRASLKKQEARGKKQEICFRGER